MKKINITPEIAEILENCDAKNRDNLLQVDIFDEQNDVDYNIDCCGENCPLYTHCMEYWKAKYKADPNSAKVRHF